MNFSLFIYFSKKEENSKTTQTSFLLLEANNANSKTIPLSSSIKWTWFDGFINHSLNFKHINIVECNISKNNQCSLNWFKTQALTIAEIECITILEMCQVKIGGTLPLILISFCLL
jgi:hypothetical protein